MSARQRICAALAANGFGQVVTIGTQLVLTPLFFRFWGAERYGEWLLLSAIPTYLMLADLGVSSAAANEMAMRAGARDFTGAQQSFRGALRMAVIAAALALFLGAIAASLVAVAQWPELQHSSHLEAGWVLFALSAQVALGFAGGTVQAGFRCAGLNGLGATWANLGRLGEAIGSAGVLLSGLGPVPLCVAMLVLRAVFLWAQWETLRRRCSWLFSPGVSVDPKFFDRLLLPSLAFMAFPLGYTLALQGPILLMGSLFGSAAVAAFSAMRTLARLPVQFTNVLNNAVAPEVSMAHGERCLEKIRRLHCSAWTATAGLGFVACLALGVFGPRLSEMWLGTGRHDQRMLLGLLAVSWVSAVWNVSSIVLTATNRHVRLSFAFLLVNAFGLGLAGMLGRAAGVPGLLTGLLLVEVTMLVWVLPIALAEQGQSLREFVSALLALRSSASKR